MAEKELKKLQNRAPTVSPEPSKYSSTAERMRHGDADAVSQKHQEEDQRMVIAREVISGLKFVASKSIETHVVVEDPEEVRRTRIYYERLSHTQQMIAGRHNKVLYDMRKERRSSTYRSLMDVMDSTYRFAELAPDLTKLVALFREAIKVLLNSTPPLSFAAVAAVAL